ncbi:hypothetical protein [Acinetobacter sp. ANC 4910]|uniref:hypothetical protein n=1 Tax=Acinetobacter sp. ANC 4910 TaxID=2529850 RepID=UPI0013F14AE9|nr:hypothetical protein [Acinetobacter sp. ANC 4910]
MPETLIKQDERDYLYLDKDKGRELVELYSETIGRFIPCGGKAYYDYVYNIEVADSNTYFVTEMGILVHH